MEYFNELIAWIAEFGKKLVDAIANLVGYFDQAGNDWEKAKDTWHSIDSKPIDEVE